MTTKVAIIIQGGNDKFLAPIRDFFSNGYEVREILDNNTDTIREALAWADITWVEWVQGVAVDVSQMERRGKLIMRMHSFEAYTSLPGDVVWENVDVLTVVSPYITELLKLRYPDIEARTNVFVLPNCIDTNRFQLPANKTRTGKIGFVGQLRHTKNLPLVLQCFAAAHSVDSSLTLHLAGEYTGTELEVAELAFYIDHLTHSMGVSEAVIMHGQVADMPTWLADKDALISASIRESFGYNIAEAMACGVLPAIHNFPGAEQIYPKALIFNTVAECQAILTKREFEPKALAQHVARHWPIKLQQLKLAELIGRMNQ